MNLLDTQFVAGRQLSKERAPNLFPQINSINKGMVNGRSMRSLSQTSSKEGDQPNRFQKDSSNINLPDSFLVPVVLKNTSQRLKNYRNFMKMSGSNSKLKHEQGMQSN